MTDLDETQSGWGGVGTPHNDSFKPVEKTCRRCGSCWVSVTISGTDQFDSPVEEMVLVPGCGCYLREQEGDNDSRR